MFNEGNENIFLLLVFIAILFVFMFSVSYLSSLYTEIDLFKLDLPQLSNNDKETIHKLAFIIKHNYRLLGVVCFIQVGLNWFFTKLVNSVLKLVFPSRSWEKFFFSILITLINSLIIEVVVRYSSFDQSKQWLITNKFLLWVAYTITNVAAPFGLIFESKKKIVNNSEEDIIRYVRNLTMDNVLEKKEAQLVQAAFNFDELLVSEVLVPRKLVVCLTTTMNDEEVKQIQIKYGFDCYPVLNKKKEVTGVLKTKDLYHALLKNDALPWQSYIDKKLVYCSPNITMDKILDSFKRDKGSCLIIVKRNNHFVGVVSLREILDCLMGDKIAFKRKKKRSFKEFF